MSSSEDGDRFPDRGDEARQVLDRNWTGRSTIPAAGLYPHQWNWDTGFVAIGRSRGDQERAEIELRSLFEGQWADGRLPYILFNPDVPADAYFPGPDFWASREHSEKAPKGIATSGITQPPLHPFAALHLYRHATDVERSRAFLREMFPRFAALYRYFRDQRAGDEGLPFLLHPWESGLDNSPAWDEAFGRVKVPTGALPPYHREDLKHGDPRDRPSDADYDRFVYLSVVYRDSGYDDAKARDLAPFLVEDPMFNTLWALGADALVEIAGIIGEDGREFAEDRDRIVRGIEAKLWDDDAARFFPFDLLDRKHMNHHAIVSFLPLFAPGIDRSKRERVAKELANSRHCTHEACLLVPSYDIGEGAFDQRRYWRGPLWVNTNWLLYQGCRSVGADRTAAELRDAVLSLVGHNGFREYYDPHGDAAYGASDFSWTAALYLDLLADAREVAE
jgi:hypothetical protein